MILNSSPSLTYKRSKRYISTNLTPQVVFDLNTPKKTGSDLIKAVKTKEGQKIKFIVMLKNVSPKVEGSDVDTASYLFLKNRWILMA